VGAANTFAKNLPVPRSRIEAFSRKWGIVEFALFGSVLRDDFGPDSDVDVLVSFGRDSTPSLLDFITMRAELSELMGRPVDALTRTGVEESENPFRRAAILSTAQVLYAAS
jgi:predicted nucleotidyltransferase